MSYHENCSKDEIWVGNTKTDGDHYKWLKSKGLKTLRLGSIAYDIYGKPMKIEDGYSPVFIGKSEAETHSDLMMQLTFGLNYKR